MYTFIEKFHGISPRTPIQALDSAYALVAHNVRLDRERLEPWREPAFVKDAIGKSLFLVGCCPVAFPSACVSLAILPRYAVATGVAAKPQVVTFTDCEWELSDLEVPKPLNPLSIYADQSCSRASDARSYTYTYVNSRGEEGAPASPSNVIHCDDGTPVTISGIRPMSGMTTRIYRAVTGFREYNVQRQEIQTSWLLVDELTDKQTEYIDRKLLEDLGPVLETEEDDTPPAELANVAAFPDAEILVGNVQNKLYFSEPFEPHNWPIKYELTLDHTIRHIGAGYGGTLYVSTCGRPYVVRCKHAVDEAPVILPIESTFPDIGYHTHSAILTDRGFIYTSNRGLILISPNGNTEVLTKPWFSQTDWMQIHPQTVRLGEYMGSLFIISDKASFVLNSELTTISDSPIDLCSSATGDLYMLIDNKIVLWNRGKQFRPFHWESRELTGQDRTSRGQSWSPASCKIQTLGTLFTLNTPQVRRIYTRSVSGEDWFRLPRVGRNLWYTIELEGIHPVDFFALGTANMTLDSGV